MKNQSKTYTYRCGEKIELDKSPDEIVVRSLPNDLDDVAIVTKQKVSSASTKIKVSSTDLEDLMQRTRASAVTHHAYYTTQSKTEFLITDRVLLTFKEGVSNTEIDEMAGRYALLLIKKFEEREYLYQLSNATGMNPVKLIVQLNENESILDIAEHDLNHRVLKYAFEVPNDPSYFRQWHLHNHLNGHDVDPRSSSRCEEAWRLLDGFGDPDVVIAVTDDGCKLDHRDFDSPNKFSDWVYLRGSRLVRSFDIDANPNDMYKLNANHGTSCCGVVAGEKDSELSVGAAPNCKLLPIKWESEGRSLDIADSKLRDVLDYISDKVDVMSNSWGIPVSTMWSLQVINRINRLTKTGGRRGRGILFLWAAGNENCLLNESSNFDVPYTHGHNAAGNWIGVDTSRRFRNNLVNIPGVMHIAALASTAKRSHYSNYGLGISLTAPSSNSHNYWRMHVAGQGITTTTGSMGISESPFAITNNFGGTSSATPLVAGIAGLCISANPNITALELEEILKSTAAKDLNFSGYTKTPPAIDDPNPSWDVSPVVPHDSGDFVDKGFVEGTWSPWFGHGCVNAEAAVAEALSRLNLPSGSQFVKNSSPSKNIPDNTVGGITDSIVCDQAFMLSGITVNVDISHTYIGDLKVSLLSPSGTQVILHNRNGVGQNDLQQVFDAVTTPSLHTLTGENVNGNWTLQVEDLAAVDLGILNSWTLELAGSTQRIQFFEKISGERVPDNSSIGIESTIVIAENNALTDVQVELDITHTYIGDLVVKLIAPNGSEIILHNRTGETADNLIRIYNTETTSALNSLQGSTIDGIWRLHVSDHAGIDLGKLNRWALEFVTD